MNMIEIVLGFVASLGIFAGGIGYLISSYRSGSKQEKSEVISSAETLTNFWKEQADGYKIMMAEKEVSWNSKFEALTRELGVLQGQLAATEQQRAQFEAILKDRNPETEEFMKNVTAAMIEIRDFMHSINAHMEVSNKGFKVESTITPDGKGHGG